MKRLILLCFCLCLIAALTPAVSAGAYYTGTIGQSSGWVQTNTDGGALSGNGPAEFNAISINDIENSQNTQSYIHFDGSGAGDVE